MRFFFLASLIPLIGCKYPKLVYRHNNTYEAELEQYHNWSVSQAEYLRGFIEESCECSGQEFKDLNCKNAAEYVLTVEYRADWHKSMSLWNAGISQVEPPRFPPEIPPVSCPMPPNRGGQ
jgi:hypothetical protein